MDDLGALALRTVSTADLIAKALTIALTHDLTTYDACYITLAQQLGVPMVTADEALVRKLAGTAHDLQWLGCFAIPPPD